PGTGSQNSALRFTNGLLYTAGNTVGTDGVLATNTLVNVFDGTNWSVLGQVTGGTVVVEDFAFVGNKVYMGGIFQSVNGVSARGLAKWDGTSWSDVGGFVGAVAGMTTDGTNLYVGGSFTNVGGTLVTNIAKWNGTNWS